MKIRVEDGRGKPVGLVEVDASAGQVALHAAKSVVVFGKTRKEELALVRDLQYGFIVKAHWKLRERLKRGGLLLPYRDASVYKEIRRVQLFRGEFVGTCKRCGEPTTGSFEADEDGDTLRMRCVNCSFKIVFSINTEVLEKVSVSTPCSTPWL